MISCGFILGRSRPFPKVNRRDIHHAQKTKNPYFPAFVKNNEDRAENHPAKVPHGVNQPGVIKGVNDVVQISDQQGGVCGVDRDAYSHGKDHARKEIFHVWHIPRLEKCQREIKPAHHRRHQASGEHRARQYKHRIVNAHTCRKESPSQHQPFPTPMKNMPRRGIPFFRVPPAVNETIQHVDAPDRERKNKPDLSLYILHPQRPAQHPHPRQPDQRSINTQQIRQ